MVKNTTNRKGGSENKTERATDNILINGNKNTAKGNNRNVLVNGENLRDGSGKELLLNKDVRKSFLGG